MDYQDVAERQKPLSLRFEHKRFWPDLKRELGVDQTGAAMALDLAHADGWVSYSRRQEHYDNCPHRYRNSIYTFKRTRGAADHFAALGLIDHAKQDPGSRGWQSAMRAKEELRRIVHGVTGGQPLQLAKPPELIGLRDAKKAWIDYDDTRQIIRWRRNTDRVNEAISSAGLDPAIAAPVIRIFNLTFKRGGRFYAVGSSWQNMRSAARKEIQIGGEPTVELDYKTLHPALLYSLAGAAMPRDCYGLDGWPRDLVKRALLVLINADNINAAHGVIAHSDGSADNEDEVRHLMQSLATPGSEEAKALAWQLLRDIKRMHKPIARYFGTGMGAELMAMDSAIAEGVMNAMLLQGEVVLPVHDSFIIRASRRDELEQAMIEAAHKFGNLTLEIEAK